MDNYTNGIIQCDGYILHYERRGAGPAVLVIGSSLYYSRLFPPDRFAGSELIFLDHRGFGRPLRAEALQRKGLVPIIEDIEHARQQLGLAEFTILGHSGHAFMAMAYGKRYPQHVRRLVLLNTAPSNSAGRQRESAECFERQADPERRSWFTRQMALLEEDIRREPERRFAHMCCRMGAQSFYDYTYDSTALWDGVQMNMPVIDYLWGEVFAEIDLLTELHTCAKPVFLGLGRYDYLVGPVTLWDALDKAPNSLVTKVVFERSGHNPMFEEPERFEQALALWLLGD